MKIKGILLFLIGFLFLSSGVYAQKENNNWYFGTNAGITFNNSIPEAVGFIPMATNEGTITVSDSKGSLLFYSDGKTVYNRDHAVMKNGAGLMGHKSATQSVLAVPKPGFPDIYYIFTVDAAENNLKTGLRYSVLDMNLDRGFGAITDTKNVLLEMPVTEKLIGVRHANDIDFWILAHKWNSNEFLAYKLTSTGVGTQPVVSTTGSIHRDTSSIGTDYSAAIGQLKANKQGTKLALAIFSLDKIEIFDFNPSTGVVFNPKSTSKPFVNAYRVEFSGDGTKLYISKINYYGIIWQFDLNSSPDLQTAITVASGLSRTGALQIGPDNKIYCVEGLSSYLGVIHNPNSTGSAVNYSSFGVHLNGKTGIVGLPNIIVTTRKPRIANLGNDTTLCEGETIRLGKKEVSGYTYLWQDGSTQSTYKVTKPGKYILKVSNGDFEVKQEINVNFKDCSPLIPNVITPNGDGLNEVFKIINLNLSNYHLQIFSRWGSRIFESSNYQNDWDGRDVSNGVYYYLLRHHQTGQTYKGWVEVVK